MTERRGNHREIPEQESQKKSYTSFVESLDLDVGEKVLRLTNDGGSDSWNVDTVKDDTIYLSRSTSKKKEPERVIMSREDLAREQYTLEATQKLLESWPKVIEHVLKNTHKPEDRKALQAHYEKVKMEAAEEAALNITLKELDPASDDAMAIFLDTVAVEVQKDVAESIQAHERNKQLEQEEKQPKIAKRGAISGLAFGKKQKITSEEVTGELQDPSLEKTTELDTEDAEESRVDLETRLAQKDAAFRDFVTKANIRSRKLDSQTMTEEDWKRFTKESEKDIADYLALAGKNPSITDEERLTVMRAHLEAIKSHELIGVGVVEYTPDESEVTKTPPSAEGAEDTMWLTLEHDMHIVENDIATRQASGKPFSAETIKKDRELLKQNLDAYMAAARKEPNPAAEKNIDRAIAFLATLDVLARKAELAEEKDETEENNIDPDATPIMAPNREISESKSKNTAKNTNTNAGSSLMTDAIKAGYKPKPPAQAFVDWIKNIFS